MNRSVAFDDLIITVNKVKNIKIRRAYVVQTHGRPSGGHFGSPGWDPVHQGGTSVHQGGPGLEFLEKDKVMQLRRENQRKGSATPQ